MRSIEETVEGGPPSLGPQSLRRPRGPFANETRVIGIKKGRQVSLTAPGPIGIS